MKAGSKVYVPNGAGKFNEKTVSVDCTLQTTFSGTGQYMIFDNGALNGQTLRVAIECESSATAPINTSVCWYDTANNIIRVYQSGEWIGGRTLPLGLVTFSSGKPISIDQVFNGFGYIGSTVFALPGVKALVPNGRNADGTLKNIEVVTNKVSTMTATWYTDYVIFIDQYSNCQYARKSGHYFEQDDMPHEPSSLYDRWYSPKENVYRTDKNSTSWEQYYVARVGEFGSGANYSVINFQTRLPFRVVDYNDVKSLGATITYWE